MEGARRENRESLHRWGGWGVIEACCQGLLDWLWRERRGIGNRVQSRNKK